MLQNGHQVINKGHEEQISLQKSFYNRKSVVRVHSEALQARKKEEERLALEAAIRAEIEEGEPS